MSAPEPAAAEPARSAGPVPADAAPPAPPPPRRIWLRNLLWTVMVLIVSLGVVSARAVISGEAELAASTEALKQGDPQEATVRARRAASWYAPGAPHVAVAYQRLIALAEAAEQNRRNDIALLAWRAVRSASLQTRSLYTPHAREAARAEREIARIAATTDAGLPPDPAALQAQLSALAARPGPSRLWSAALIAAFALAVMGLLWATRRLAAAAGKLDWTAARAPLLLTVTAIAVWLFAIWRA